MADYLAMARTNYFMVIDEERYQELFQHLVTNGKVEDFTKEQDGVLYHGFGAYGSIDYQVDLKSEESEFDFDYFTNELQKILPVDEAFIYTSERKIFPILNNTFFARIITGIGIVRNWR